jgi:hypothetical protein
MSGGTNVSIVRVGLAETNKFAEGYEAIFGKKARSKTETRARKTGKPKKKSKRRR